MTTNPLLATLIPLVADLSRDLPEDERYRRLLQALRDLLPCDATALLRLDGEYLIPLVYETSDPHSLHTLPSWKNTVFDTTLYPKHLQI